MAAPFPFVAGAVLTAAQLNLIEPSLVPPIGFLSGSYYAGPYTSVSSVLTTVSQLQLRPIYVPSTTTFDRITVNSGTTVTNPTLVRIGIYTSVNAVPGALVLDAGTVSMTTTDTGYEITISQSLTAGWYWLGAVNQTAASVTHLYNAAGSFTSSGITRVSSLLSNLQGYGLTVSSITGALPATLTSPVAVSGGPLIKLRKS